jgi:glutathione S-transferase
MITVYGAYGFPDAVKGIVRDFRIMWALEELGLAYDMHWIDFGKGEHKLPPNTHLNPFGKVPSFEDGALRMFESGAAVLYLYDRAGKLPHNPQARAELNQWCFAAVNTVEPELLEVFRWDLFWTSKPGREWRYPEVTALAHERLTALQTGLAGKPYLLGEFGPADILMTAALDFIRHAPQLFEGHDQIRDYLARNKARPAYARAFAKHGAGPAAKAA